MEVTVRLFATLREGRFRERKLEVDNGSRVIDILNQCHIPKEEAKLCLVNGCFVHFDGLLRTGDILSVFPPVGGG